jgi:ABC-2 type transport system permease protein
MTAIVFARKELHEILRTWRIWVLPGIVLFFAVTGPLLARFTPELLGAVVGNSLNGLKLPTPTYFDSYAQWVKNLSQILLIAVIIVYGGLVSGEVRSGTAVLVLTKPLSRHAFVTVKAAVHSLFLAAIVAAGTLITWGLTWLIFGAAPGSALLTATGEFLVLGLFFVCLMTLLSSLIRSTAGAAGAGLAAYIVLAIAAIWKPLGDYSPAALTAQPAALAAGREVTATWPVVTAMVVAIALVAFAGWSFRRQDL